MIDVVSPGLFRRHVLGRARNHAASRHTGVVNRSRKAEIGDHHPFHAVLQEDIRRLDVAVNEALSVRGGQPDAVCMPIRRISTTAKRARLRDTLFQRLSFHHGHHQVGKSTLLVDCLDRNDVLMHDRGSRLRLTREAVAGRGVGGKFGRQDLDRRMPIQRRVVAAHDHPHSAAAENLRDFVAAKTPQRFGIVAGCQELNRAFVRARRV